MTARPALQHFVSIPAMIQALEPDEPVQCIRPHRIAGNATRFLAGFPGTVAYAVKANPHPAVLRTLHHAGVRCFDVASLEEIAATVDACPGAELFFHNPVKSREAIRTAYQRYGVRRFVADHGGELAKLLEEAGRDVTVLIRVAVRGEAVAQDFSSKFGAENDQAVSLLRAASDAGVRTGLAFHLGTHCTDPTAYGRALRQCGEVATRAGVPIDCVSIGGGFPGAYESQALPPLDHYFATIASAWRELALPDCMLLCEPGRALVADGASVVARVRLRRGDRLFLSDGPSGSLGDLWYQQRDAPLRAWRTTGAVGGPPAAFRIAGPLAFDCDDDVPGVFSLAAAVQADDWVEIGELGAYGVAMAADFQEFHDPGTVTLGPDDDDG